MKHGDREFLRFPGVSLIRGDGSLIGKPATRRGPVGKVVRIAPGKTVQADLHTLNRGIKGKYAD